MHVPWSPPSRPLSGSPPTTLDGAKKQVHRLTPLQSAWQRTCASEASPSHSCLGRVTQADWKATSVFAARTVSVNHERKMTRLLLVFVRLLVLSLFFWEISSTDRPR